jgi:hypothetical protein
MKTKTLSPKYRITQEDFERGHKLFAKEFADGQTLTEQERYLQDLLLDAEQMHGKTGVYPTVEEVHNYWQQEAHDRERKRIASWQDGYTFTQRDFDTLAEDDSGPMLDFVQTAKALKSKTGKFPTVANVRTELKLSRVSQ